MDANLISTTILVAHWLIVVGLSLRVIGRRLPVGVSVAWLAVMFSLPFAGAGVYLLFGEKRLGRRRAAEIAAQGAAVRRWQQSLGQQHAASLATSEEGPRTIARLVDRGLGFPALAGNEIELLASFQEIFDRLVADIDRAQERCHLSFYIWHQAGRTAEVVEALVRATRRGVRCRALADSIGSKDFLRGELAARLRREDVELRAALPTGPLPTLFTRLDLRNHRKLVVIDRRIAYTGSQNLADPRFFMHGSTAGEWVDAMARITGPAVAALDGVFELDWSLETEGEFEPPGEVPTRSPAPAGAPLQVVPSGPDLRPEAIHQLLLTAIYSARQELVMTTPYFVPDDSILSALLTAALRGVDVKLIVPARNDSLLVRYASAATFDDLLAAGAHVALFRGGLLHTKSLAIDGETSIFGSVNLDMRSLWLNFEISLVVYDPGFTGRLRALQDDYLADSDELELESWRRRPLWRRLAEDTFRLLGPLI